MPLKRTPPPTLKRVDVESGNPVQLTDFETHCMYQCGQTAVFDSLDDPDRTLLLFRMQDETSGTARLIFNFTGGSAWIRVYNHPEAVAMIDPGAKMLYDSGDEVSDSFMVDLQSDSQMLYVDILQKNNAEGSVKMGCYTSTSSVTNPDPPEFSEAIGLEVETEEGSSVSILPLQNDTRKDRYIFSTLTIVEEPTIGTVTALNDGSVVYSVPASTAGQTDSFHYTVKDVLGITYCGTVTVNIVASAPPVQWEAVDDAYQVAENNTIICDVLNNDLGEFAVTSVRLLSQPSLGTATVNKNEGTIAYAAPDVSSDQQVTFDYEVRDIYGRNYSATVTIDVIAVPATGQANPDTYNLNYSNRQSFLYYLSVLANDDPPNVGWDLSTLRVTTAAIFGSTQNRNDGTIRYRSPLAGFLTNDFFWYTIDDNAGNSYTAQVTINLKFKDAETVLPPPSLAGDIVLLDSLSKVILPGSTKNLGTYNVGTVAYLPITIRNVGSANINVSGMNVSGLGYSGAPLGTPILTPSGQWTVNIALDLTTPGTYTGSLTVVSNDPDTPNYVVNLTYTVEGNAQPPEPPSPVQNIQLNNPLRQFVRDTGTYNWGKVNLNDTVTRRFYIKNRGQSGSTLVVTNNSLNSVFSGTPSAGNSFSLIAATETYIDISVDTSMAGNFSGKWIVNSNDPDTPVYTVNFNIQIEDAFPAIQVLNWNDQNQLPGSNAFLGSFFIGEMVGGGFAVQPQSPSRTFKIVNTGNDDLVITGLGISGSVFTETFAALPVTITPGNEEELKISIDTATAGNFIETVTITSNDPNRGSYAFDVSAEVYATQGSIPSI